MAEPLKQKVFSLLLVLILMAGILPGGAAEAAVCQIQPTSAVIDLAQGSTLQLSARLSGAAPNELRWQSGNTAVATVDGNGLVTAKKTGSVRIGVRIPGKTSWSLCSLIVKKTRPSAIVLSCSSASLLVGETLGVSATVKPLIVSQNVIWQTSNKNVATVSPEGLITAKKVGTCRIRATSAVQKKLRKHLILKVTDGIPPTEIRLTAPRTALKVGDQVTLTPAITPENASSKLVWSSSNTKIATVSGGVVTAKRVGTVRIRAKSAAAPAVYGTLEITVLDPRAVETIRITSDDFYLDKDNTRQLSAVLSLAGTAVQAEWHSDKPTVASVTTTGKVTGLSAGTAVITATAGDMSDTVLVTVLTQDRSISLPVRYLDSADGINQNKKEIQDIFSSAINELECCVARGKMNFQDELLGAGCPEAIPAAGIRHV